MKLENIWSFAELSGLDKDKLTERIHEKYSELIIKGELKKFKTLKESTGVDPKLSEGDIQKGYYSCTDSFDLKDFKVLQELTGVAPSAETIQRCYSHLLSFNLIVDYSERNNYMMFLDRVDKLKEITGISPSEEIVQKAYAACVEVGSIGMSFLGSDEHYLCSLKEVQEAMGIEPKLSEEVVQKGYAFCIKNGLSDEFRLLNEMTGIEPDLSEKPVQDQPRKPSESEIQMNYSLFVAKGDISEFKKLKESTGVDPKLSEGDIHQGYVACIINQRPDSFKLLHEMTEVKPLKEVYDELLTFYFKKSSE